jgi:hypothetical protein
MNPNDRNTGTMSMVPQVSLDPKTRETVRILGLGHAEATVRPSTSARLDVLMEVSAAVCDLFAPAPADDQFQLMHFDVHYGPLSRSTLPAFDNDVVRRLKRNFGPRMVVDVVTGRETDQQTAKPSQWLLMFPKGCKQAVHLLAAHWREWIRDFKLYEWAEQPSWLPQGAQPNAADRNEFHDSLRHAFDVINDDAPESAFTLEIDYSDTPYFVSKAKDHKEKFSLGYCIPSSRVEDIVARLDRDHPREHCACAADHNGLKLLETILRPADGMPFRSQPHTNVKTRLASLVRNQHMRDRMLPKPNRYEIPGQPPLDHKHFDSLERAVWGTQPADIFLMPLTNHAFMNGTATAQTLALWYVICRKEESLERLFYRRFRASQLFSECLYERYCKALGRCLARNIVHGKTDPVILQTACEQIAATYRLPICFRAEHATDQTMSLHDAITALRRTVPGAGKSGWSATTAGNLRSVGIRFYATPIRHTFRTDLLLRVQRAIETETPRIHGGSLNTAYANFSGQLDFLRKKLVDSEQLQRSLRVAFDQLSHDVGLPSVPWTRVAALRNLYHGPRAQGTPCDPHNQPEPFGDDWTFLVGHDMCSSKCSICVQELERRLAFLVGASPQGGNEHAPTALFHVMPAQQRAHKLLKDLGDSWNWIKRACNPDTDGETRVSTAALVVLLMLQGANVEWNSRLMKMRLTGVPPLWHKGLAGIAMLARSEQRDLEKDGAPDKEGPVKIVIESERVVFILSGLHYSLWFEAQQEAAKAKLPGEGNSRKVAIAAALMPSCTDVPLGAMPEIAQRQGSVTKDPDQVSFAWSIGGVSRLEGCD